MLIEGDARPVELDFPGGVNNLLPDAAVDFCVSEPDAGTALKALPGRLMVFPS